VCVSVKDISLEGFLSNLMFIVIESEIESEGLWVEGKETVRCVTCGWIGGV
jgi:hypothetical protein